MARQQIAGPAQAQRGAVQPLRGQIKALLDAARQMGLDGIERIEMLLPLRRCELSRGRRCGRAQVGHQIGEGDVGFVSDAADHRQLGRCNRQYQTLVVEGPEVFQRATAAHEKQRIHFIALVGDLQRAHQRGRRVGALHQARIHDHAHMRRTAFQRRQHVMQGRTGRRSDNAQVQRKARQWLLACGIEVAERFKPRLHAQELFVQRAGAGLAHAFDDELQLAARLVHRHASTQLHQLPITRAEVQQAGRTAEHRATHRRRLPLGILEIEVAMPAGRAREAADLAADDHTRKTRREAVGNRRQKGRDAPNHAC